MSEQQMLMCTHAPSGQRMFVQGGLYKVINNGPFGTQFEIIDSIGCERIIGSELTFITRNDGPFTKPVIEKAKFEKVQS